MTQTNALKLFDDQKVRTVWDDESEKWYFSIIDVIEVLTDSPRARKYWNALKTKLIAEGSQLSQKLGQLKMQAEDGKMRITDIISKLKIPINEKIQQHYTASTYQYSDRTRYLYKRVEQIFGGIGI